LNASCSAGISPGVRRLIEIYLKAQIDMANTEHLVVLNHGKEAWNLWRRNYPEVQPDLSRADLSHREFLFFDFSNANLGEANLAKSELSGANLSGAILVAADLSETGLSGAKLPNTDLSKAILVATNFNAADLGGAKFIGADFFYTNLSRANLNEADFSKAIMVMVTFGNNDLSVAKNLENISHRGPSTIGVDTLYKSGGRIPEVFLRGCGVPDGFIEYVPSLIGAQQAIQFYSCFISYSHKDKEFAKRLHSRMRAEHLRVWFAPEDMKGGKKVHEQIDRAIQIHDRLLIVLSENSMQSEWVKSEIRKARKVEIKENRQKLFPIRLANFDTLREWECFDADSGKDLAVEVREYFIPDFSNWKNHDEFESAFEKLVEDLRAAESHN
jgi:uncharacterized protein YjbI with pentapeptide repeats